MIGTDTCTYTYTTPTARIGYVVPTWGWATRRQLDWRFIGKQEHQIHLPSCMAHSVQLGTLCSLARPTRWEGTALRHSTRISWALGRKNTHPYTLSISMWLQHLLHMRNTKPWEVQQHRSTVGQLHTYSPQCYMMPKDIAFTLLNAPLVGAYTQIHTCAHMHKHALSHTCIKTHTHVLTAIYIAILHYIWERDKRILAH